MPSPPQPRIWVQWCAVGHRLIISDLGPGALLIVEFLANDAVAIQSRHRAIGSNRAEQPYVLPGPSRFLGPGLHYCGRYGSVVRLGSGSELDEILFDHTMRCWCEVASVDRLGVLLVERWPVRNNSFVVVPHTGRYSLALHEVLRFQRDDGTIACLRGFLYIT